MGAAESSESDDSELGSRESPMIYNGGVRLGSPEPPAEWRDYQEDRPSRRAAYREHPRVDRTHPPLNCLSPRISEPLRGYRCPACARRMHHVDNQWDRFEAADRFWSVIGRALAQCRELVSGLPRAAEVAIGLALTAGGVLAILSLQGWIPR